METEQSSLVNPSGEPRAGNSRARKVMSITKKLMICILSPITKPIRKLYFNVRVPEAQKWQNNAWLFGFLLMEVMAEPESIDESRKLATDDNCKR